MSLRFITISSLLLLVIASTLFTAFRYKDGSNAGFISASDEVQIRPKNMYLFAAAAAAREKTLGSRKMVVDKEKTLNKKAKMNVIARGKQSSSRRTILSRNKNVKFVAFTADYNKPRHHPPKNN